MYFFYFHILILGRTSFQFIQKRKLYWLPFNLKLLSSSSYPLISPKTKVSFNKAFHYVLQLSRGCECIMKTLAKQKFIFNRNIYRNYQEGCSFKRHCSCQKYISASIVWCSQAHGKICWWRQTMHFTVLPGCKANSNTEAVSCGWRGKSKVLRTHDNEEHVGTDYKIKYFNSDVFPELCMNTLTISGSVVAVQLMKPQH